MVFVFATSNFATAKRDEEGCGVFSIHEKKHQRIQSIELHSM